MIQEFIVPLPTQERIRLSEIRGKSSDGNLHVEDVIADANDPSSPLYRYFTHDRDQALYKCNLQEAQALIRRYHVRPQPGGPPIRGLIKIPGEAGYACTLEVLKDEPRAAKAAGRMKSEVDWLIARNRNFARYCPVFASVIAILEKTSREIQEVVEREERMLDLV